MSFTTHENLEKATAGALDWGDILNQNMDKIEAGRHLTLTAGESISSCQVAYISSSGTLMKSTHATDHIGVCPSAVNSGAQGQIRLLGVIENGNWSWSVGNLYCGSDSNLTATPVSSDNVSIAYAFAPTKVIVMESGLLKTIKTFINSIAAKTGVGSFTCNTSNYLYVNNTNIQAKSVIAFTPTNTVAALLQAGANPIYLNSVDTGSGFSIKTSVGSNFVGTETFYYSYNL